ncbi:hypothetical protein PTTG_01070 [Puccinia triticina 1-1 BBBD Race 1]|uniref:Uncharacterized protein n=2 Tax=Puccinia triticina TaxID=208348 RepID=A0A0C4EJZ7_PUCT1|nr:uncharacterized protein PtA15_10A669 [Puccinia triticina]OAV97780.1 hypothetical protein PTTG_01070 [Puccinia triticina 1-1 BBBD Race 1]WAQ89245.1 hypothetical protein PtA15_10A669 [Puccinia triticina]WAR59297.1 hypothetical protein PtB15_10B639 [Puccinia triticina]
MVYLPIQLGDHPVEFVAAPNPPTADDLARQLNFIETFVGLNYPGDLDAMVNQDANARWERVEQHMATTNHLLANIREDVATMREDIVQIRHRADQTDARIQRLETATLGLLQVFGPATRRLLAEYQHQAQPNRRVQPHRAARGGGQPN